MKIYIAGASAEVDMIRALIKSVKTMGFEVTRDWTEYIVPCVSDANLSEEVAFRRACDDLTIGVMPADILWFVVPPKGRSAGAWVELGAALGMRSFRPIVIVSGDIKQSIFLRLNDQHFATEQEALDSLQRIITAWNAQKGKTVEQIVASVSTPTKRNA